MPAATEYHRSPHSQTPSKRDGYTVTDNHGFPDSRRIQGQAFTSLPARFGMVPIQSADATNAALAKSYFVRHLIFGPQKLQNPYKNKLQ